MGRSLSLAVYLARAARRVEAGDAADYARRPEGTVLWCDAGTPAALRALAEIVARLRAERPRVHIVVTAPAEAGGAPADLPPGALWAPPPPESGSSIERFLAHWRPSLAILSGERLPPLAIHLAHRAGIPLLMLGGPSDAAGADHVSPGILKSLLQRFDRLLVPDAAAATRIARQGAPLARIEVTGRIDDCGAVLECNEAERTALSNVLKARPVWLAAAVPSGEERVVVTALRAALRLSHRLLLVLAPADPARGPALADALVADGWEVALRSRDDDPDAEDQIYIADTEGEFGLWYRLAPVVYLGGTLSPHADQRHPFEAAALGSAILHGPRTEAFADAYARLAGAGAARMVYDATALGEAVGDLLAPDRAAALAHNAWRVASDGGETVERITARVLEHVELAEALRRGASDARGPTPLVAAQ